MKRVLMTDHSIRPATENRCLNCGNDSPCSCTEPMPAAEVYARHRERQAAAAGQRYEPHCDCNGGHVQMMSDPSGRWLLADDSASSIVQHMPEAANTPRAWFDVLAERRRQISDEGWTPKHDDAHDECEMAFAAAVYALESACPSDWQDRQRQDAIRELWPWDAWHKSTTQRRDLVKAGALILAEIERLDRADKQEGQAHG